MLLTPSAASAKTIYLKNGQIIKTKFVKHRDGQLWYEKQVGASIGNIGMDIEEIEKIVNDDLSLYNLKDEPLKETPPINAEKEHDEDDEHNEDDELFDSLAAIKDSFPKKEREQYIEKLNAGEISIKDEQARINMAMTQQRLKKSDLIKTRILLTYKKNLKEHKEKIKEKKIQEKKIKEKNKKEKEILKKFKEIRATTNIFSKDLF